MKNVLSKILKITIFTIGFLLLVIGFYIAYIFSALNKNIDNKKLDLLISEIKTTPKHEEKLITMYNKIHKNAIEKSSCHHLWNQLLGKRSECPCLDVARISYVSDRRRFAGNNFIVANRIEQNLSQRDCLNFIFKNFDYLYGNKGVHQAAKFYFQKPISELKEDELVGLIVMQENPSLYNPKKFKERFDRKVNEALSKIDP